MNSSLENFKDFTILYVEDETSIRSNVEHCLKYVFNVISAEDGEEGLHKFNTESIDVIITDINMPVRDGISMLKTIRESCPNTPFIITSAYDAEYMSRVEELGIYKFMPKPFDMKELVLNTMEALK